MTGFQFDQSKSFEENCKTFIDELETHDAELAGILRRNWYQLLSVVQGGESSSRNRTEFNTAIASALDELIERPDAGEDE